MGAIAGVERVCTNRLMNKDLPLLGVSGEEASRKIRGDDSPRGVTPGGQMTLCRHPAIAAIAAEVARVTNARRPRSRARILGETTVAWSFDCPSRLRATIANMETIHILTDKSKHAQCGGLLSMAHEAPLYVIEHEGLETRIPGVEMVCSKCGELIRSQAQVEVEAA
jgi:hypothetical protein